MIEKFASNQSIPSKNNYENKYFCFFSTYHCVPPTMVVSISNRQPMNLIIKLPYVKVDHSELRIQRNKEKQNKKKFYFSLNKFQLNQNPKFKSFLKQTKKERRNQIVFHLFYFISTILPEHF